MSIMSDRYIRNQCQTPEYKVVRPDGTSYYLSGNPTEQEKREMQMQSQFAETLGGENITLADMNLNHYIKLTDADKDAWIPMIAPFVPGQVRKDDAGNRILSHGTTSYGYDVRLARDFKIFTNINNALIDPLEDNSDCYIDRSGDYCIIPPNSYVLGHTVEVFTIPKDIMVVCVGKSTYARLGAMVNCTPIEPGFEGQIVIEIANCSTLPLKVYAGQGIAQFLFFQGNEPCENPYDSSRKYQGQRGIQTAML